MPLLKVNVRRDVPVLEGGGDLDSALRDALARCTPGAPLVILIHGYKFSPARAETSPHAHILSLTPRRDCWKARSWPRALGFDGQAPDEGVCIAFGWEARGSIWGAWTRALAAGLALADLLGRLGRAGAPAASVVGHSLGARVALGALPHVAPGSVGRMLLLVGAEMRSTARSALATPAGRAAEVVNVTSRENDVFDWLLEWLVAAPRPGARALGAGLPDAPRNWLDLPLDSPAVRSALEGIGYTIPAPDRRICHWSSYLRSGVFTLYADLLRTPAALPLCFLRGQIDRFTPTAPSSRRLGRLLPMLSGALRQP